MARLGRSARPPSSRLESRFRRLARKPDDGRGVARAARRRGAGGETVSDAPRAQETGRHYLLVGGHGGGGAGFHPALPLPDHGGLDVELLAHLGQGLLSFQDLLDQQLGSRPRAAIYAKRSTSILLAMLCCLLA